MIEIKNDAIDKKSLKKIGKCIQAVYFLLLLLVFSKE